MRTSLAILLFLLGLNCPGQDKNPLTIRGFVDTYHAFQVNEPNELLASRSRFRGEIQKVNGNSYMFISVNAIHNNAIPDLSGIKLREAYLEYTGTNWGFKAGRQIIIWGKADGLKITDIISPMDLTEFLAQDYDDIRMPVNGLTMKTFNDNWDLELVCVPVFQAYILPGENSPWGQDLTGSGMVMDEAIEPGLALHNVEFGGKLSFYLSGIDFDLSALRSWNKTPAYSYYLNDSTSDLHLIPEHKRLSFAGLGFCKSVGDFILRGEGAFYFGKHFSPDPTCYESGLFEKNSINYLFGVDWYAGNQWMITGQFSDEVIMNYKPCMGQKEHTYISTLGISKKVLHSTLTISSFAYVGLAEGDFFNRSSLDYSLSDNIHLLAGFDWFHGDNGIFGQYQDNTEVWIKAKYNF